MTKYYCSLLLLWICPLLLGAQSRSNIEKERKSLQKNIKKTTAAIKSTQKNKKATLQKYLLLKEQAQSRAEFIKNLQDDLTTLETSVARNQEIVTALKNDLNQAKKDYVHFVKKAYRQKHSNQRLHYLFSAKNFNDAIRRWQYLKQYHRFRKKQARYISDTQTSIATKVSVLAMQAKEKQDILDMAAAQKEELDKAVANKNKLLKQLTNKEKALKKELDQQRKAKNQLNNALEAAIMAENRKRRKRSKTRQGLKSKPPKLSKSETKLASSFRKMRGRLTMPVKGKIVGKFGVQVHPTNKRVKIKNDGVYIRTSKNAVVKSVYQGKVVSVVYVPSLENAIMVQHGNYYTVYSGIQKVLVKKGQTIKKGQSIGRVGTIKGKSELYFQIWKNETRLNPEQWLRK